MIHIANKIPFAHSYSREKSPKGPLAMIFCVFRFLIIMVQFLPLHLFYVAGDGVNLIYVTMKTVVRRQTFYLNSMVAFLRQNGKAHQHS